MVRTRYVVGRRPSVSLAKRISRAHTSPLPYPPLAVLHTQQSWTQTERLHELYEAIRVGANSFLMAEYKMCALFVGVASPLIFFLISKGSEGPTIGFFSAVSFAVGAITSFLL